MERWQKHEEHDKEVRALLEDLGFVDSKGRIRRMDGKVFWPKIRELGHTSMGFAGCKCAQRKHLRIVK